MKFFRYAHVWGWDSDEVDIWICKADNIEDAFIKFKEKSGEKIIKDDIIEFNFDSNNNCCCVY